MVAVCEQTDMVCTSPAASRHNVKHDCAHLPSERCGKQEKALEDDLSVKRQSAAARLALCSKV